MQKTISRIFTYFISFLSGCLFFGLSACNKESYSSEQTSNKPDSDLSFVLSEDKTFYILDSVKTSKKNILSIPDTYKNLPVKEIGERACYYVPRLTQVIIPDSVCSIGDFAFDSCFDLTEVVIGSSVVSIGRNAFSSSSGNLKRIIVKNPIGWQNSLGAAVDFSNPTQAAEILGGPAGYLVYTRS